MRKGAVNFSCFDLLLTNAIVGGQHWCIYMKGHLLLCSVLVTSPRQELRDIHDASPGMAKSTRANTRKNVQPELERHGVRCAKLVRSLPKK